MKIHLFVLFALAFVSCKQKPTITEWRGPERNGIYLETNLLDSWPESGPQLLWEAENVGNGYSSPIINDGFLYITGEIDSLGYLFKFDPKGNEVWRSEYGYEWVKNFPGSRGTPTLCGNEIYMLSGKGDLTCINAESGNTIWQINLKEKFNAVSPFFGFSQALAIEGDRIFCLPGGDEHNTVALNRFNGELIWSNPCFKERPAYNSPKIIEWANKKILVTFSAYHLFGLDVETGELLWSHEQTNIEPEKRSMGRGDTHSNTILFDNGYLYYVEADGNCGVKLKLSIDGQSIEEVWKTDLLDNYMGGFVKLDEKLYTSSHRRQHLMAVSCETAEKTDSLKLGRGSTIFADGKIYFFSERGNICLIGLDEGKMKEISSFKVEKGTKEYFAHPVISNGVLYLRHGQYLGAYNIKKQS